MPNNPLVTVICLCYNHEKFVTEALESVINQSYKNIEIIIIDDASSDNSVKIIENWLQKFPQIQFIKNESNLGNTKSFNKASKYAQGDYLIDFATDDILITDCIEKQIHQFENSTYKNLGLVYGNAENINENSTFNSYYFDVSDDKKVIEKRPTGDIYKNVIDSGNSICSVSAMILKKVFDELNGYDENLVYEDLDFWIRLSRNYEIDFIDTILIKKRITENSLGTNFYKKKDARARAINYSTYLILKKAIQLNQSATENKTVLKRVHFEMILAYKTRNYILLLKYIPLEFKLKYLSK